MSEKWNARLGTAGLAVMVIGAVMLFLELHEIPVFGTRLGLWGFVPTLLGGGVMVFFLRKVGPKTEEIWGKDAWLKIVGLGVLIGGFVLYGLSRH